MNAMRARLGLITILAASMLSLSLTGCSTGGDARIESGSQQVTVTYYYLPG